MAVRRRGPRSAAQIAASRKRKEWHEKPLLVGRVRKRNDH